MKMATKTTQQISDNMKKIKNKDSKIEITLRRELWKRGLRYQKNRKDVFGNPDIVFKRKKIAVFCDSEFWHGYNWDVRKSDFKTHQNFWLSKIERNIKRDEEVTLALTGQGWTVLRFWGKEILKKTNECADIIERIYRKNDIKKQITIN